MAWLQAVRSVSNSTTMVSMGTACRMLALRPLLVSSVVRPKGAASGVGHCLASQYALSEACRWEPAWAMRAANLDGALYPVKYIQSASFMDGWLRESSLRRFPRGVSGIGKPPRLLSSAFSYTLHAHGHLVVMYGCFIGAKQYELLICDVM
uniref:Uncharacterized protein n=1 Tax=Aegilops tauschii TaxID=37682 RepID=M8BR26_AEGTA